MNLIQRAQSPTPTFFKKLRNIGLLLAAISATVLASPVALPVIVVNIAGYAALAGSVITVVSQLTTGSDTPAKNPPGNDDSSRIGDDNYPLMPAQ